MEQMPSFENGQEKIPTKEEVMEIINRRIESPEKTETLREISDENGLHILDLRVQEKEPGATAEYLYCRKGVMPNGVETSQTSIEVSYYQDGDIVGGSRVAVFDEQTGEWKE